MKRHRILVVRGHQATPWELMQWEALPSDRFETALLCTRSNRFDIQRLRLERRRVRALRDYLPEGVIGDAAVFAVGDRYLQLDRHLKWPDVVHAEELSYWFTASIARRKRRHTFKLVVTAWETIPMLNAYRNPKARAFRDEVLRAADLFLPTTERARKALLLEGVKADRILTCTPGIDIERFRKARDTAGPVNEHLIVSPGRLVWEKGHQDVIRALALIKRRLVNGGDSPARAKVLIVGSGPEEGRLRRYAQELGVADAVEIRRNVPYEDMPSVYGSASCMVLASLPSAYSLPPRIFEPKVFWEEQFGMVLIEAMASGLAIIASTSGAIPEVLGDSADYFAPGDWEGLARSLVKGPLARAPGERTACPETRMAELSLEAAAARFTAAYERVLQS